jgi:type IX secretion system PorP/SprF family membrane protein
MRVMKKIIIISISFLLIAFTTTAQSQYSQFMLNTYGVNPAVAGSAKGLQFMFGRRTQWRGFDLAPETNFVNFTKDFGRKGIRHYWHGVGAYLEEDRFGLFLNRSGYGSYAIHLKLSSKYFLSFAIAAGFKSIAVDNYAIADKDDPALNQKANKIIIPDIFPGMYLYSKNSSVSLSVRNLYKNTLTQGNKSIGSPSKLRPAILLTINHKYRSENYDYVFVPAINLQSNFTEIPSIQFNCMAYYRQRVGLGVTYRMHDAICAMLQIRIYSNLVIGFAYDYTISRFRFADANSTEMMMGFSPSMYNESGVRGRVADCPKFEL